MRHLGCSAIALAGMTCSGVAMSCTCLAPDGSLAEQVEVAVRDSAFVAVVEIVSTTTVVVAKEESGLTWSWRDNQYREYTEVVDEELLVAELNILKLWKGDEKTKSVATSVAWQACGLSLQSTQQLLLFATGPDDEGRVRADSCGRTTSLKDAAKDIEVLDGLRSDEPPNYALERTRQR